ncbi:hypothetical protein H2248_007083 [Termitomyces sp. 'cryptogamus']|nr:hypothetical protein H2248_007083 [Termitomyces sp. 'cryptogamus']
MNRKKDLLSVSLPQGHTQNPSLSRPHTPAPANAVSHSFPSSIISSTRLSTTAFFEPAQSTLTQSSSQTNSRPPLGSGNTGTLLRSLTDAKNLTAFLICHVRSESVELCGHDVNDAREASSAAWTLREDEDVWGAQELQLRCAYIRVLRHSALAHRRPGVWGGGREKRDRRAYRGTGGLDVCRGEADFYLWVRRVDMTVYAQSP